jgi:molybdopterin biosynthesis enzyme
MIADWAGAPDAGLPVRKMRLAEPVNGQSGWTQFVHGRLEETSDLPLFYPLNLPSHLQMMSAAEAIVKIPEGKAMIDQWEVVSGQVLN